jgi:hypothetical protein
MEEMIGERHMRDNRPPKAWKKREIEPIRVHDELIWITSSINPKSNIPLTS